MKANHLSSLIITHREGENLFSSFCRNERLATKGHMQPIGGTFGVSSAAVISTILRNFPDTSFCRRRRFGHKRAQSSQRIENRKKVVRDRSSHRLGLAGKPGGGLAAPSRTAAKPRSEVHDYFRKRRARPEGTRGPGLFSSFCQKWELSGERRRRSARTEPASHGVTGLVGAGLFSSFGQNAFAQGFLTPAGRQRSQGMEITTWTPGEDDYRRWERDCLLNTPCLWRN